MEIDREFNDDIGKAVVTAQMEVMPDEEKYWWASSLNFTQSAGFHKPGIVYSVRLILSCHSDLIVEAVLIVWSSGRFGRCCAEIGEQKATGKEIHAGWKE